MDGMGGLILIIKSGIKAFSYLSQTIKVGKIIGQIAVTELRKLCKLIGIQ